MDCLKFDNLKINFDFISLTNIKRTIKITNSKEKIIT